MKKTVAWTMTADTAMEFYKRCMDRNANTEEEKVKILVELAEEGKMDHVVATDKTKEEYIAHKAKHYNIIEARKKDETN